MEMEIDKDDLICLMATIIRTQLNVKDVAEAVTIAKEIYDEVLHRRD